MTSLFISSVRHYMFPSVLRHCWLGDRKGIRPEKNWVSVCCWWWFDWSFERLIAPVVTTTSIILCFNKQRLTQVHREPALLHATVDGVERAQLLELMPARPGASQNGLYHQTGSWSSNSVTMHQGHILQLPAPGLGRVPNPYGPSLPVAGDPIKLGILVPNGLDVQSGHTTATFFRLLFNCLIFVLFFQRLPQKFRFRSVPKSLIRFQRSLQIAEAGFFTAAQTKVSKHRSSPGKHH